MTAAVVAGGVSLVGAVISYSAQALSLKRQLEHEDRHTEDQRLHEARAVRSRYRDPLLTSAYALHSRLVNIVDRRLFEQPAETAIRASGRDYATESTLYALGEFLCWREILRREVQYLDLGNDEATRKLNVCFEGIMDVLAQNDPRLGNAFRLFRMEQRAIGELMIERSAGGAMNPIGPARFSRELATTEFAEWFAPLESNLVEIAARDPGALARLALLQNWIVTFIDQFDPHGVVLAGKRQRLAVPDEFASLAPPSTAVGPPASTSVSAV